MPQPQPQPQPQPANINTDVLAAAGSLRMMQVHLNSSALLLAGCRWLR